MTPEPSPRIPPFDADETFQASFRRGRTLVLLLAVLTAGYLLSSSLHEYLTGKNSDGWSGLLLGWAFTGWFCWRIFRGGPLVGGCLLFLAIPVLLVLGFGGVAVFGNLVIPTGHFSMGFNDFHGIGSDWRSTLSFLPLGAWAAYTVWVLRISRDARLYREARQQGIAADEARNVEWPPRRRRQQ